jgi:hypothetical protein
MGWFGDRTVLVQKPRKSGCLFLLTLFGFAAVTAVLVVVGAVGMRGR